MTGVEITSQNLIDELRRAFPEIEDRYQEEIRSWNGESPGNYNIFAFVFKPFIHEELAKGNNSDFLGRFCGFLERVCTSDDKEAINVIWLKIFKLLLADPSTVKQLWPLLGSATKANLADAALRWGLVRSVPAVGLIDGLKHWVGLE
jgi:hypothetical protein